MASQRVPPRTAQIIIGPTNEDGSPRRSATPEQLAQITALIKNGENVHLRMKPHSDIRGAFQGSVDLSFLNEQHQGDEDMWGTLDRLLEILGYIRLPDQAIIGPDFRARFVAIKDGLPPSTNG